VHAALSDQYMRRQATGVCGLKLLVYAALSDQYMRRQATGVCGLKLLVYAALKMYNHIITNNRDYFVLIYK
jgi:hypothetical protein